MRPEGKAAKAEIAVQGPLERDWAGKRSMRWACSWQSLRIGYLMRVRGAGFATQLAEQLCPLNRWERHE